MASNKRYAQSCVLFSSKDERQRIKDFAHRRGTNVSTLARMLLLKEMREEEREDWKAGMEPKADPK